MSRCQQCGAPRGKRRSYYGVILCGQCEAKMQSLAFCSHYRRGPIQRDDSQECLDCRIVIVSDG